MSRKNSNNTSQLYIICGNKGGIGKSLVALTVAAVLEEKGRELIMVDTDKDNGSLIKPYANNTRGVGLMPLNLNSEHGWEYLCDYAFGHPEKTFVIDTPAGILAAMKDWGAQAAAALNNICAMRLLWVCDPNGDALNALEIILNERPFDNLRIDVIRNEHLNPMGSGVTLDTMYSSVMNHSAMVKIRERGGAVVDFPRLLTSTANLGIMHNRLSIFDIVHLPEDPELRKAEIDRQHSCGISLLGRGNLVIWLAKVKDNFSLLNL